MRKKLYSSCIEIIRFWKRYLSISLLCIVIILVITIILFFYKMEQRIGEDINAAFYIKTKAVFRQDNCDISIYEFSYICRKEFIAQIGIRETDLEHPDKKIIKDGGYVIVEMALGNPNARQQLITFNSHHGIYWYLDVIVIVTSEGAFCIFDKEKNKKDIINIMPDYITHRKIVATYKNYSLTELKKSKIDWKFSPCYYIDNSSNNDTLMLGTMYPFLYAFLFNVTNTEPPVIKISTGVVVKE
jgi:hypothetical protein